MFNDLMTFDIDCYCDIDQQYHILNIILFGMSFDSRSGILMAIKSCCLISYAHMFIK